MSREQTRRTKTLQPSRRGGRSGLTEKMLRLARKNKPPQSWYDETVNPFQSKKQARTPGRRKAD